MTLRRLFAVTLALIATGAASAGSLTPPPGPVGPTMKTLTEVEPRTPVQSLPGSATAVYEISQPGSYYLTGNIQGVAGKDGINIATGDVVLDLNGFSLNGVPGSGHAVTNPAGPTLYNVIVKNGTVRGWGGSGIRVDFLGAIVSDIVATSNGQYGVAAGANAIITRCTARANGGFAGIATCCFGMITDCVSRENSGDGFEAASSTLFRGNVAQQNAGNGIDIVNECTVENNLVSDNLGAGIRATAFANRIDSNNCVDNGIGVEATGCNSVIIHNTANGNTVNYSIAGCNDAGPIGSAATATSPMANIAY